MAPDEPPRSTATSATRPPGLEDASRDGREIDLEDIARLQALRTQIVAYAVSASRRADAQSAGAESTQRAIIAVAIAGPDRTPEQFGVSERAAAVAGAMRRGLLE